MGIINKMILNNKRDDDDSDGHDGDDGDDDDEGDSNGLRKYVNITSFPLTVHT